MQQRARGDQKALRVARARAGAKRMGAVALRPRRSPLLLMRRARRRKPDRHGRANAMSGGTHSRPERTDRRRDTGFLRRAAAQAQSLARWNAVGAREWPADVPATTVRWPERCLQRQRQRRRRPQRAVATVQERRSTATLSLRSPAHE
jgi:hypothetical protein